MDNPNENVLKTDLGTPIGEIVIADNTPVPTTDVLGEVKKSVEDDLTRQLAQNLTGDADDASLNELFPMYTDTSLQKRAARLFVVDHKTFPEISEELHVPERTLSRWAYDHQWLMVAKQDLAVQQEMDLYGLGKLRIEHRTDVAKAQLEGARTIREAAITSLNNGASVKSVAEAFKSAADVENRILGISESGSVADINPTAPESKESSGQQGKVPLVMVFQGGLPPVRKSSETINI